jgi:hypothetical protein
VTRLHIFSDFGMSLLTSAATNLKRI